MADGLTPKQQRFVQHYLECGNASEAYRKCYNAANMKPETVNRAAKELLDNPKIAASIEKLQESHRKRHNVTVDSLTEELHETRLLATQDKQHSAAIAATLGKAKLHGLLIDKNEHTGKDGGPIVTQTKEQRDATVAAALAADS